VVEACARELLVSYGLRSLAPKDPAYRGQYTGDPWQRDAAYHQGTVWSWLLGPFARAHYRVYGDADRKSTRLNSSHITISYAVFCLKKKNKNKKPNKTKKKKKRKKKNEKKKKQY